MKKKANIYDADDVERSKRLNFTPEERAARAEHKAEVLGTKLEKAKKKVPKKKIMYVALRVIRSTSAIYIIF